MRKAPFKAQFPVCFLALLLLSANTLAGTYKCVSDSGAIEFSDKPCLGAKSVEGVKIQDNRLSGPSPRGRTYQSNDPHVAQLDTLVMKAIAMKDYAKARELAVTQDHWAMISAAEKEELKRKAEAANNRRPVFCSGASMNHGYVTTTNTICR